MFLKKTCMQCQLPVISTSWGTELQHTPLVRARCRKFPINTPNNGAYTSNNQQLAIQEFLTSRGSLYTHIRDHP